MGALALPSLAALAVLLSGAAARGPLPWSVRVAVGWGDGPGSVALLEQAEAALLSELNARGCFREFRAAGAEGEEAEPGILLEVTIWGLEEETRYDQSMAERIRPIDVVETALGETARIEASVRIRLVAAPAGRAIREDSLRESAASGPLSPGDEARARARAEFAKEVARRARALLCKGSAARLEEQVRAALAAAP